MIKIWLCRGLAMVILCLALAAFPLSAKAEEQVIKFSPVPTNKLELVRQLLMRDEGFRGGLARGEISFPENIRIAEVALNQRGEKALLVMEEGVAWCGNGGCPINIWRSRKGDWQKIGEVSSFERDLLIQEVADQGYHRLVNRSLDIADNKPEHLIWDGFSYRIYDPN